MISFSEYAFSKPFHRGGSAYFLRAGQKIKKNLGLTPASHLPNIHSPHLKNGMTVPSSMAMTLDKILCVRYLALFLVQGGKFPNGDCY